MVALVAGLVLAFAALGALGVWQAHEAARQQVAQQILGTARALARVVDAELGRTEALLQGLAAMPALRAGDADAFLAEARALLAALDLPALAVVGRDGRQLASTLAPGRRGAEAPPAAPEAMRVFETGRTEISDLSPGIVTGRPRIVLAVPVRPGPGDEEMRYVLGAVLPRERLTAALVDQRLPEGWVAAVLDRRHTVVARTRREEAVVGRSATPPVRAGLEAGDEGLIFDIANFDIANQDGERSVVGYARAPRFGYAVALAAPEAAFAGARWAALARLGAIALPIAAAALLLALLLRRTLARALRGLAGGGTAAAPGAPPRLREVQELAAALDAERAARDAVEAALRERTAWFEAAQQAARVGVWQRDLRDGRSRWSAGMRRILGLPDPGGAEAAPPEGGWLAAVHPEDRGRVAAAERAQLAPGAPPFREEFRVLAADGSVRWVRSQGVVEREAEGGRPLRVLGAWIDITARRALEEEREALARQRDLLAAEIHHRIRKSLQLVLSLLVMQARRATVPEAAASLREAASRIGTIANVHRRLYEAGADAAGDLAAYLSGLAQDLHASVGGGGPAADRPLRLELEPGIAVPPAELPAIGIIATELMTNAQKYGRGATTLRLRRDGRGGGVELAVEDEGPGLPAGYDPAAAAGSQDLAAGGPGRGLSMRVVATLARQLGAGLEVDRAAPGGRVVLRLPPEAAAAAPPDQAAPPAPPAAPPAAAA
jgi:PAS domain S-box-containing protein